MRWLTNIYNPNLPDARSYLPRAFDETPEQAWREHLQWLADKIIGEPKPSEQVSVQELKNKNIVGVYSR